MLYVYMHACKIQEKSLKRKLPLEGSIHHRNHAYKLSPAVQHRQESQRKHFMSQSKEVNPVHNSAVKKSSLTFLTHQGKRKKKLQVTGKSEKSVRMSALNHTHQAMNRNGEHGTKTRRVMRRERKGNKGWFL